METKPCPHCDVEVRNAVQLDGHIKKVHRKVLCLEWGLLFEKTRPIEWPHQKDSWKNTMPKMWIIVWKNSSNWLTTSKY